MVCATKTSSFVAYERILGKREGSKMLIPCSPKWYIREEEEKETIGIVMAVLFIRPFIYYALINKTALAIPTVL